MEIGGRSIVGLEVDVTPNSGGHEHHDANRPKGTLSRLQGTTDANGEVKVVFTAPEPAGLHNIKATCTDCSKSPATKEIKVWIPNLVPIDPNPLRSADGSFLYSLTSVDATHQGDGRYHHNQYWLTDGARSNLNDLLFKFADAGWGTVALNDASLYWGGRYDIKGNWTKPHAGHRTGEEIDISFTRARNPISRKKQDTFYDDFCKTKDASIPFTILHHFVLQPHFHVYLNGQKACFKSER